jgi:amino acid transporter
VLVDLGVSVGAFVAAMAGVNLTARTVFAMSREGGMPRAFAWTHPRFRTPWIAIASVLVLTIALVVVVARIAWNDPFKYFGFMATTATFGILAAYILIALAGMVYFWRSRGTTGTAYNVLLDVVLPLGAVAICGYTIYESFRAPGPSPNTWSPWIALAWLAAGVVVLALLHATHPERVRSFGSILGAGEGAPNDGGAATAVPGSHT